MDSQRFQVFVQGVNQVFSTWTILNLSVEGGWSGRFANKKREELIQEVIMSFHSGRKVNSNNLANFLMEAMETRFSTIVEDDSDLEVAELICEMYDQCSKGDYSLVEKIMNIQKAPLENCKMQSYIVDDNGMNISDIDTEESGEEI
ncbi:Pre-rRNA-processing protein TSR2 family protein [Cryptosporidium meleagridis]|uniref:Pre-rRNA-processing protein TSR2 family protein n=1 Tax=Cryptosporidium meleagridis TaxID=93969 RepID=A0A2P4Z162_9CRYT|nr:Pre-rRNA-processing protein TSR2 family protein [Cryptosporidium meleagridis]